MLMNERDKFIQAGIPYDDIDIEMVDLLSVLNFGLDIRTKFSCYGHEEGRLTYIMFDEEVSDESIARLLQAVDSNVGSSGVNGTKLYKWARKAHKTSFREPRTLSMNWILEVSHPIESDRRERIHKITESLKEMVERP